jgi:hypothetical protein
MVCQGAGKNIKVTCYRLHPSTSLHSGNCWFKKMVAPSLCLWPASATTNGTPGSHCRYCWITTIAVGRLQRSIRDTSTEVHNRMALGWGNIHGGWHCALRHCTDKRGTAYVPAGVWWQTMSTAMLVGTAIAVVIAGDNILQGSWYSTREQQRAFCTIDVHGGAGIVAINLPCTWVRWGLTPMTHLRPWAPIGLGSICRSSDEVRAPTSACNGCVTSLLCQRPFV